MNSPTFAFKYNKQARSEYLNKPINGKKVELSNEKNIETLNLHQTDTPKHHPVQKNDSSHITPSI